MQQLGNDFVYVGTYTLWADPTVDRNLAWVNRHLTETFHEEVESLKDQNPEKYDFQKKHAKLEIEDLHRGICRVADKVGDIYLRQIPKNILEQIIAGRGEAELREATKNVAQSIMNYPTHICLISHDNTKEQPKKLEEAPPKENTLPLDLPCRLNHLHFHMLAEDWLNNEPYIHQLCKERNIFQILIDQKGEYVYVAALNQSPNEALKSIAEIAKKVDQDVEDFWSIVDGFSYISNPQNERNSEDPNVKKLLPKISHLTDRYKDPTFVSHMHVQFSYAQPNQYLASRMLNKIHSFFTRSRPQIQSGS